MSELGTLLERKRREARDTVLGYKAEVAASGFFDTQEDTVLISGRAFELARGEKMSDDIKRTRNEAGAAAAADRTATRIKQARDETEHCRDPAWSRRAAAANLYAAAFKARVRPLWKRRAIAKSRTPRKRCGT